MPVVWLVQTSKTSNTLILPTVTVNNKTLPQKTVDTYNWKFTLNKLVILLLNGQVCSKEFPFTTPMAIQALEFGGDSALRDQEKSCKWMYFDWSTWKPFEFVNCIETSKYCMWRYAWIFLVNIVEKIKYFWLILPVTLTDTHGNLSARFFLPMESYQLQYLIKVI